MSSFGGPRLILTVPGGSSRPNKTSSVKKSKFSKLSLMPFCQITVGGCGHDYPPDDGISQIRRMCDMITKSSLAVRCIAGI